MGKFKIRSEGLRRTIAAFSKSVMPPKRRTAAAKDTTKAVTTAKSSAKHRAAGIHVVEAVPVARTKSATHRRIPAGRNRRSNDQDSDEDTPLVEDEERLVRLRADADAVAAEEAAAEAQATAVAERSYGLVDESALSFFKNQQYGSRGIRQETVRAALAGDLRLPLRDYINFYDSLDHHSVNPLQTEEPPGSTSRARNAPQGYSRRTAVDTGVGDHWQWELLTGGNILVMGVGDKSALLTNFINDRLDGEDVIELYGSVSAAASISGRNSSTPYTMSSVNNLNGSSLNALRNIRNLLNTISESFLGQPDLPRVFTHDNIVAYAHAVAERLDSHYQRRVLGPQRAAVPDWQRHIPPMDLAGWDVTMDNIRDVRSVAVSTDTANDEFSMAAVEIASNKKSGMSVELRHTRTGKVLQNITSSKQASHGSFSESVATASIMRTGNSNNANRSIYNQRRLYLVIHEICGSQFDHSVAQRALSILASAASVSIIASVDSLNLLLSWDVQTYTSFRWRVQHTPTYVHTRVPMDHLLLLPTTVSRTSSIICSGLALTIVLQSLTRSHNELLQLFCKEIISRLVRGGLSTITPPNGTTSKKPTIEYTSFNLTPSQVTEVTKSLVVTPTGREISLRDAVMLGTGRLVVKSKSELFVLLKEFRDHRILETGDTKSTEVLRILLEPADIIKLASE